MTNVRSILLASAASLVIAGSAVPAMAADQALNGAITSPSGEKLGGVTVSAKQDGSTITTSVYTDETGNYYFPPLPPGVPTGGHGGSHGYLMNEFVTSVIEDRKPLVNIAVALNLTVAGIVAHQSALKNGELMKIPQYIL